MQCAIIVRGECAASGARSDEYAGLVDAVVNYADEATAAPVTRETPEQFRSVVDLGVNGWGRLGCIEVHAADIPGT